MTTVRRVRRIIRKIDPWTVLKVASVFNVVAALGIVLGLVMFWSVLTAAGIPDRIVDVLVRITLLEEGENPFVNTERFLRAAVFGSIVWAVLSTGLMTLAAVMYNLISDVVGGVEIVVLEESLVPIAAPANPPAPRRWAPAAPNGAKNEPSESPTLRPKKSPPSRRLGKRPPRNWVWSGSPYPPRLAATRPMPSARARYRSGTSQTLTMPAGGSSATPAARQIADRNR